MMEVTSMSLSEYVTLSGFVVVGLIGTVIGARWLIDIFQFMQGAVRINGEIADIKELEDQRGFGWRLYIKFRTISGEEIVFPDNVAGSFRYGHVGKPVTVVYHPEHPESARLLRFASLWEGPILCLVVFPLILVFGCLKLLGWL